MAFHIIEETVYVLHVDVAARYAQCSVWHNQPELNLAHGLAILPPYPNNAAARNAIMAQAKCSKARYFSGFLAQRTRIRRKRIASHA